MSSQLGFLLALPEAQVVDEPASGRWLAAPLQRSAGVCASLTALIGLAVLVGWAFDMDLLTAIIPGQNRMKANAAFCFAVMGLGLAAALHSRRARWLSQIAAVSVLVVASLTLVEYAGRVNLQIDETLFRDPMQLTYPGRMAHISALNFFLAGLALLLMNGSMWARRIAQGLSLVVFTFAFAAILSSLYGAPVLFGSGRYTSMALHTGVGFLVLGVGLLLAPADGIVTRVLTAKERGGWLARRALPWVLFMPPLLGWLYLRPGLSFRSPVFSMAMFAVTLTVAGTGTLYVLANFFNREERQTAELNRIRERSAASIRQSEQELRLITDQLPTLLSYIDTNGRFVRVNRTYELWMGRPSDEIVGRTVLDILGEAYWKGTLEARELAARGEIATFDAVYPTLQGERNVQVTYAPDRDDQGVLQGMACLVLDVHDRHRAEAALRQSEKLAAVGRLASSIAHEINNPLEAVTNLLYLAEQDTNSPYIAQAQHELARVTHIVTQTLRFHRQSTVPVVCTVSVLLDQVLVLYQGKLAQGNITVERRWRDGKALRCRDGELRQVLANLIGNAADAMRGGGRLLLRAGSTTHPKTGAPGVRVTIADTGHGISATTRRTLFEPFHTTKGATGSGLGLWISSDLVVRHGGTLRVRSSTRPGGSGTVFQVFFANLDPAEGT